MAAGAHSITATYSGDSNFTGSTGSLTQGVIGVIMVTSSQYSGSGTLLNAIGTSVSGDTIEFAPGMAGATITLVASEQAGMLFGPLEWRLAPDRGVGGDQRADNQR